MEEVSSEYKEALLYELEQFTNKLNYEIYQIRSQQESVETRYQGLKHDILVHVIYFAVPTVIFLLIMFIRSYSLFTDMLFMVASNLVAGVSILAAPFFLVGFIRAIVRFRKHREPRYWQLPAIRRSEKRVRRPEEANLWAEREKLQWVMREYEKYQTEAAGMQEKIVHSDEVTEESLQEFIDGVEFYEAITPAKL